MHQRRRIILLFGAGIVLPSLLLGYLAFRGIQNDRALLEKERLEETRQAAERVLRAVDEEIAAVEAGLSRATAAPPGVLALDAAAPLKGLGASSPLIEEIFYLQDLQEIHFPVARLLYVPDGSRKSDPRPSADPGVAARIRTAQQLEFRDISYRRALAVYQQALGQTGEASLKGSILTAIARVQKKSGRPQDALATYEKIVREHRQTIIPEIPFTMGEHIRIKDGPFSDFTGVIDEINVERGKLRVLVSIFGRETPVELDFLQVESI